MARLLGRRSVVGGEERRVTTRARVGAAVGCGCYLCDWCCGDVDLRVGSGDVSVVPATTISPDRPAPDRPEPDCGPQPVTTALLARRSSPEQNLALVEREPALPIRLQLRSLVGRGRDNLGESPPQSQLSHRSRRGPLSDSTWRGFTVPHDRYNSRKARNHLAKLAHDTPAGYDLVVARRSFTRSEAAADRRAAPAGHPRRNPPLFTERCRTRPRTAP